MKNKSKDELLEENSCKTPSSIIGKTLPIIKMKLNLNSYFLNKNSNNLNILDEKVNEKVKEIVDKYELMIAGLKEQHKEKLKSIANKNDIIHDVAKGVEEKVDQKLAKIEQNLAKFKNLDSLADTLKSALDVVEEYRRAVRKDNNFNNNSSHLFSSDTIVELNK